MNLQKNNLLFLQVHLSTIKKINIFLMGGLAWERLHDDLGPLV